MFLKGPKHDPKGAGGRFLAVSFQVRGRGGVRLGFLWAGRACSACHTCNLRALHAFFVPYLYFACLTCISVPWAASLAENRIQIASGEQYMPQVCEQVIVRARADLQLGPPDPGDPLFKNPIIHSTRTQQSLRARPDSSLSGDN